MMTHLQHPVQILAHTLITQTLKKEFLVITILHIFIFYRFKLNLIVNIILGSMNWVQRQIMGGINPRRLLHQVFGASVPSQLEDITLWRVSNIQLNFIVEFLIIIIIYQ